MHSLQVLRGQEIATEQGKEIAKGLDETSARLNGLSDSLSAELTAALSEIARQVSLAWVNEYFYNYDPGSSDAGGNGAPRLLQSPFPPSVDIPKYTCFLPIKALPFVPKTVRVTVDVDQETVLANLARVQDDAAEQASRVLHELGSAKSELSSYMESIEADRRY